MTIGMSWLGLRSAFGIAAGGLEPLVLGGGVVEREVSHEPHAAIPKAHTATTTCGATIQTAIELIVQSRKAVCPPCIAALTCA